VTDDWDRVDTGGPDSDLMVRVRTIAEDYEPLVTSTEFDDLLNPGAVHLYLGDGIEAESGRFDVTWTTKRYYSMITVLYYLIVVCYSVNLYRPDTQSSVLAH